MSKTSDTPNTHDYKHMFDFPPTPRPDSVKWELARRKAEDMEPYWVADMDFPAPPPVLEAVRDRLDNGLLGYSFSGDSVFEAFRQWQRRRLGVEQDDHWCALPGVMGGVRGAVARFSEPGDTVIVQTPVYFPFMDAVEGQGRTLAVNSLIHDGERYRIDFDDLEEHARRGAKVILLCSPHNPVGRVWEREELQSLVDVCRRHDILLVSDEIHGDLLIPGYQFVPAAALDCEGARVLTLASATKSFNIPGLPAAMAISGNSELIDEIRTHVHVSGAEMANVLTMQAVEAAYRYGDEWLDAVMRYISENDREVREVFARSNAKVSLEPLEGTYLLWIDCRRISHDDVALRSLLQEQARAWLVEGSKFGPGGEGYLRMNIAAPRERVVAAARRIAEVLERQQ